MKSFLLFISGIFAAGATSGITSWLVLNGDTCGFSASDDDRREQRFQQNKEYKRNRCDQHGNEKTWADHFAQPIVSRVNAPDWIIERDKALNAAPMIRIHAPEHS